MAYVVSGATGQWSEHDRVLPGARRLPEVFQPETTAVDGRRRVQHDYHGIALCPGRPATARRGNGPGSPVGRHPAAAGTALGVAAVARSPAARAAELNRADVRRSLRGIPAPRTRGFSPSH